MLRLISLGVFVSGLLASHLAATAANFEVTITNLTRGQRFTPILVASHKAGVKLFELGRPASPELAVLAEEGNVAPLDDMLNTMPEVLDTANSGGLLNPGASVTVTVKTQGDFNHVSVASMLIPTNDAFFALNGVAGPRGPEALAYTSVAYDAGSERNDELCASIPGPFFTECGGPGGGGAPSGGEEGYVHVHAGMHGIGDFNAAQRDWRNPVALIVIRRVP
jgi:hypothetical protein